MLIICTVINVFNKYIRRVLCPGNEKITLLRSQSHIIIVLCDQSAEFLILMSLTSAPLTHSHPYLITE